MNSKKGTHFIVPFFTLKVKLTDFFLNLCSLAHAVTEIVKLSSANLTVSYNLNLADNGRMNGEYSFNSAAVRYSSYSKGLGNSAVLLGDNCSFKNLNSELVAFLDFNMHLYSVTDFDNRCVCLEAVVADLLECVHFNFLLSFQTFLPAEFLDGDRGLSALMSLSGINPRPFARNIISSKRRIFKCFKIITHESTFFKCAHIKFYHKTLMFFVLIALKLSISENIKKYAPLIKSDRFILKKFIIRATASTSAGVIIQVTIEMICHTLIIVVHIKLHYMNVHQVKN